MGKSKNRKRKRDFKDKEGHKVSTKSDEVIKAPTETQEELLKRAYKGFASLSYEQIPQEFHLKARKAFERLRDANYYQYDIVQAGGKILSRTFVRRTLVGEPGITYKYLGLRLFAHPWSGKDANPMFREVDDINETMINYTKQLMRKEGINEGSCQYNLTLINYMEPSSEIALKEESGIGKVAVSWHADSSLEPCSSIGVYHCLPTQKTSKWDWKIALRKDPKSEVQEPVVVVPTKANEMYFLLGDFNDKNQHMVIAGSASHRISSTHRVAVTEHDTYSYIYRRVKHAKKHLKIQLRLPSPKHWDRKEIIECLDIHTEVEFQWIRQYWIQGEQHDAMRPWWQAPIRELEQLWVVLESFTKKLVELCTREVSRDLIKDIVAALTSRNELRIKWKEREEDKVYKHRMARGFQPVARPAYPEKSLGADLQPAIDSLKHLTE